jgi:tetratricopeptide (TPR) repeat protein
MRSSFLRQAALSALVALCVTASTAVADIESDWKAANTAYAAGNFAEAERLAGEILNQELTQGRASVLILRGLARYIQGKNEPAVSDFTSAFAVADKAQKGIIRYDRFLTLLDLERLDEAYKDLLVLAQSYPDEIKDVALRNVFRVGRHLLEKDRHDDFLVLLLALKKANYRGPDPLITTDYLHKYLIEELVGHNRAEEAVPLIADLTQYDALLELRISRHFAALWENPSVMPLLQPQDFPARHLGAAQKLAAQHPKSLNAVMQLVSALRLNGRYDDALQLAQAALNEPAKYEPNTEMELWLKNELAYVLQAQGRFAESTAALEPLLAKSAKEDGKLVNQFINLGVMFLQQGRYAEAVAAAEKARGFSSSYGDKFIQYVNACAAYRTGKTNEAETMLLEILSKPDDNYGAVTDTLLCLNHEDQAAAMVLKRLNDKLQQSEMLGELQDCRENPQRPPLARELHAALIKIRERPEIQAAVTPLGVIIAEPIACGDN